MFDPALLDCFIENFGRKLLPPLPFNMAKTARNFKAYQDEHPHLKVTTTGLWVNPKYPQLGSSPDGVVEDTITGEIGLVEIKCPFVLRHCSPLCARENLSKKQNNHF